MRSLPELVEFIRVSCKSQNSSITKMEKDLKFANGTVGKWANGKRYPPKDKLLLVADFLQISIEELMGEAPEQKEKPTPSEESELNAHAKAILYKYEQLDPAQRVMFEKMLDAALEAAKGERMKIRNKEIEPFIRADKEAWKRYKRSLPKKTIRQIGSSIWKFMEKTAPFVAWFSGILTVASQIASFKK